MHLQQTMVLGLERPGRNGTTRFTVDPIRFIPCDFHRGWPWIWWWVGSLGRLAEVDTHWYLCVFVSQILRVTDFTGTSCQGLNVFPALCLFPSHFEMMLQEVLDHWPQENGPLPIVEKPSTPDGPVPVTPAPSRPLEARDRHSPKHFFRCVWAVWVC